MANEVQNLLDHWDLHATPKGVDYLQELYDEIGEGVRIGDRRIYDEMRFPPITEKMARINSWASYTSENIMSENHDEDWREELVMFNAIISALDGP